MQTKINSKDHIIIDVNNLTCKFNDAQNNEIIAVNNFSFQFLENKIYFIIGNSGSGKSTLVAHLNGLLKSRKGNIRVGDFVISEKLRKIKNAKKLRRIVSMVFQFPEYQLFKTTIEKDIGFGPISLMIPKIKSREINTQRLHQELFNKYLDEISLHLKINSNLKYSHFEDFLRLNNLKIKIKIKSEKDFAITHIYRDNPKLKWSKKIAYQTKTEGDYIHEITKKYLLRMGLDESYLDRSPFGLSGGQKRRVAIAGILAIEPKILIFDEPTAGLDPKGEQEMMDIIIDAKVNNKQTIIVITHTMDQVLEIGDYVIVMDEGKILMHGTPYEIFTNKDLYLKTKMEKPKIIDIIDCLCEKNKKFSILYDKQPKNIDELSNSIKEILIPSQQLNFQKTKSNFLNLNGTSEQKFSLKKAELDKEKFPQKSKFEKFCR